MLFFKKLRRLASLTKPADEEEEEEWIEAKDDESSAQNAGAPSEMVFELKYLGSRLVESSNNEHETAEAIRTVSSMAKANGKKVQRVALAVSLEGVRMTDLATEEEKLRVSIYRISQCPPGEGQAFAFVATNLNETMECHVFACPKRGSLARDVGLALGRAFDAACELWRMDHADSRMYHTTHTLQFPFDDFYPDSACTPDKEESPSRDDRSYSSSSTICDSSNNPNDKQEENNNKVEEKNQNLDELKLNKQNHDSNFILDDDRRIVI